jgi:cyclopropane-fatty-acyl-phospholipid synthase
MTWTLDLVERGWIPDPLVRHGIRRLLAQRIRDIHADPDSTTDLIEEMRRSPLAIATDSANEQHYEVPPAFFEMVLGSHLKYSCCAWPKGVSNLDDAEAAALELSCSRARLEDGQRVLDLGCGWGSLSLWIARRFPRSRVTAVSNSAPQGEFIRRRAADLGLDNLEVVTADMNHFEPEGVFDRIVSVEMFEHMRNQERLLERVAGWLAADGRLFVHVFCHRSRPYLFEDSGPNDWMARHFFTGGLMPSEHLLEELPSPLRVERRWRLDGRHYEKTALAWLANMDRQRAEILEIFKPVYGRDAERWIHRWRMFFLACAELFGHRKGEEWYVSHTLWRHDEAVVN